MSVIPKEVINYVSERVCGYVSFYNYLEYFNGEILQRTFACRKLFGKNLEIIEVMQRVVNGSKFFVRNLWFSGWGYRVNFNKLENFEVITDKRKCPIGLISYCINPELVFSYNKYKYCAYPGGWVNPIDYLNIYTKYKGLEFLTKLNIPMSVKLLRLTSKDKQFCKYLCKNAQEVRCYGVEAIIYAYKNKKDIADSYNYLSLKRSIDIDFRHYSSLNELISNKKVLKNYLIKKQISVSNYNDYYFACINLCLNMSEEKNLMPKDFKRMHDLRINEYKSKKAKENLKEKRKLYKNFREVSKKYDFLNYTKDYAVIIAPTVQSLVREGKELNHCVGEMGYDEKMAEEETLILFIRKLDNLKKPFVTLEYSLSEHKILQIYGYDDTDPEESVMKFANHWLKIVNRRLSKFEKKVA